MNMMTDIQNFHTISHFLMLISSFNLWRLFIISCPYDMTFFQPPIPWQENLTTRMSQEVRIKRRGSVGYNRTSSTRTSRGRKFPLYKKKHKPIRTLGPIEKNHPPALSLTCLLLWSCQRMCWIAIPLTPSKYSVKCVLSLDLQSRFRNEVTP